MKIGLNFLNLAKTHTWKLALVFIFIALLNTLIFGFTHEYSWQDAFEYSAYASSISSGNGYTLDGENVSIHREPGYPTFVALFYKIFGDENVTAVFITQAVLLGLIGLMVYMIFLKLNYPSVGLYAGTVISAFPIYGYYAAELLTELLFTFLLVSIFYNLFLLLKAQDVRQKYILAGILGLLCGYITLVRVQFLFFLPLLVLALLILKGYRTLFKYLLISLVIFMIILGSWMSYVYVNTGAIGLTKGREGAMLYSRVARTELSYTDQSRYLVAWLSRSVPGSNWENDPILSKYGWTGTSQAYEKIATSSLQIEKIKEENIHTIVTNPGHFLFGNLIELVKLLYLGHLDSTILGPVFRALIYVLVYSWFIFGMIHFIRPSKKREVKMVQLLLLFFIVYNVAVLTFLDTIPRYNVPYLVFFLLVGFAGLALVQKTPEVDYKKSYENKEDNIF